MLRSVLCAATRSLQRRAVSDARNLSTSFSTVLSAPVPAQHGGLREPVRNATALDAVSSIRSGDCVFVHSVSCAPIPLLNALAERSSELRDIELVHIHTEGEARYADPQHAAAFRVRSLFVGANMRKAVLNGNASYVPIFLSDIPDLFRRGVVNIDTALINVSPPDRHGFCSLGPSVDITVAAVQTAKHVVAQFNRHVPRVHGDGFVHMSQIDSFFECDAPLLSGPMRETSTAAIQKIGSYVASLVEDGACLQMGIGAIPDAVLSALRGHKHLGIHTEMCSDGLIDLIQSGVVTNAQKTVLPGKVVCGFAMGTQRLYDFMDDNPMFIMRDMAFVNSVFEISKNRKATAINSCIEIDLTGQVCADSIGTLQYSGVGGQVDFMKAAALSEGGKPIIALPSVTARGESRIVSILKPGAGVVTSRAHVHYVVTEYGVVNLYGKTMAERALALIGIAHPDHRERLEREALERFPHMHRWH